MILLCGIRSESPLAMVREALDHIGAPYLMLNQRRVETARLEVRISTGEVGGRLRYEGRLYHLEDFQAVYTRLMDDRFLPELEGEPEGSPRRQACRTFHDTLSQWIEISPARVVNRARPMGSNFSKPYQSQLIREAGFRVPETLVTNDPDLVTAFRAEHGRIIYKSVSGARSIVSLLEDEDLPRLDRIRWCPVQFQACLEGTDVRVHTIGRRCFATAIHGNGVDYRYSGARGGDARLEAIELPQDVAEACVSLAARLELDFAGIDLKIGEDGEVHCFEVNPSPAFSYYESHTGQPIATTLARYLAGTGESA